MAISNNPMMYCSKVKAVILTNSISQIDILGMISRNHIRRLLSE